MPLRFLIYFTICLKLWIGRVDADIFARKSVKIPTPHFVVFYNGTENRSEGEEPDLEVKCVVYSINPGKNAGLMQKSKVLSGYMHFVNKVRDKTKAGKPLESAIDDAIQECINEDVLKRFFETRKDEVRKAMKWDLTMERHMRIMKKEEREEGRLEGTLLRLIKLVQKKVKKGKTLEEVADDLEMEGQEVEMIYNLVLENGADSNPDTILSKIQEKDSAYLTAGMN